MRFLIAVKFHIDHRRKHVLDVYKRQVDLLPLTGITFPLVSNGGSSMAASFAMLAFIESVQNTGRKGEKRR